jgi:hypothetical protein
MASAAYKPRATPPAKDLVVTDVELDVLRLCPGHGWNQTHRPELYKSFNVSLGCELPLQTVRSSGKLI